MTIHPVVAVASISALVGTCLVPLTAGQAQDPRATPTDFGAVVRTLDSEIPALLAESGVVGATVALVDGDRVIMTKGYGWADRREQRPVTRRTLFHIGSLSKTLTATSVLQLVEQGRVDLDAPMEQYVPELRLLPRFRGNTITVRSVLDHHSGIPGDIFYGLITMKKPDPHFHRWLLKTLANMPPERRVNRLWAYNNSGYVLLQALVENVTGQPYAQRTDRTLFHRMRMPSSTFDDRVPAAKDMTRNYSQELDANGAPTGVVRRDPREYVNGWTAGSVVSNAHDMANYLRMLVDDGRGERARVLPKGTLERMWTPQTDLPIDGSVHIGLSWFPSESWLGQVVGHDGATTRNFSSLLLAPDHDLGVFVSTNTTGGSAVAASVAGRALQLAVTAKTGLEPPAPPALPVAPTVTPTERQLARAAGSYASYISHGRVRREGTSLRFDTYMGSEIHQRSFELMSNGWWREASDPAIQIAFARIAGRNVLRIRVPGATRIDSQIWGQRVPTTAIPATWRSAIGSYRTHLNSTHATDLVPEVVSVRRSHGLLVLSLGEDDAEVQVLRPIQKDHAYTYGLGNGGRRKGDIVWLDGSRLTYMGVTYRRQ